MENEKELKKLIEDYKESLEQQKKDQIEEFNVLHKSLKAIHV